MANKISDMVEVACYNHTEVMSRTAALEKYLDCMMNSEGPERERYEKIFFQLMMNRKVCSDNIDWRAL